MTPRFFVPAPLASAELHNLFYFKFSPERLTTNVFKEPPFPNYFETATYVERSEEANVLVLPNNFNTLSGDAVAYIRQWADEGERLHIPVYVFSFGDFSYEVPFDERVRVFLMSSYKSVLRPNNILVPTTARSFEDVVRVPRPKQEIPLVSFCGFAGFKTRKQWVKYLIKNARWDIAAYARPLLAARKLGIYWRRVAMRALESSPLVTTNFIVRRSFSGAARTIELSPDQARKEFIESIIAADFVLTPKGDGNYSNRFLETLSLGRIPVLIDTDTPLPCEDVIPYDKIVVRVPMLEVKRAAEYVRRFYDALTPDAWKERQMLAHELFEKHLRQEVFFKEYFDTLSLP